MWVLLQGVNNNCNEGPPDGQKLYDGIGFLKLTMIMSDIQAHTK